MPTIITIDGVTLTLKKYPEFDPGTPTATDITLFATPVDGTLFKTTMDNLIANILNVDNVTITGDGSSGNPLTAGAAVFADNGLHVESGGIVYLGGTLLENTTINTTSAFTLNVNGSTTTPLAVASSTAAGISSVASSSGTAISGSSSSGLGGYFFSTSGIGCTIQSLTSQVLQCVQSTSGTNDITTNVNFERGGNGTAANGFGTKLTFTLETSPGFSGSIANEIKSKWTDVATSTRTSQIIITGVNNATTDDILKLGDRVTLTESSATTFATTTVPTGKIGGGEITVTITADDATDFQARTLRFIWVAENKAGTTTITISTPEEVVAASAGTLTATITAVDSGSGVVDFQANAVSSLTQTTLRCSYQMSKNF